MNADSAIRQLLQRQLIREADREAGSGATLYETTELLLAKLGLNSWRSCRRSRPSCLMTRRRRSSPKVTTNPPATLRHNETFNGSAETSGRTTRISAPTLTHTAPSVPGHKD